MSGVIKLLAQANPLIGQRLKVDSRIKGFTPSVMYSVSDKIDPHNHQKPHICLYYNWPQPWRLTPQANSPTALPRIHVPIVVDHIALQKALGYGLRPNISRVKGKPDETNYFLSAAALPHMAPFQVVTIRPQDMTGAHAVFINDNKDTGILHGSSSVPLPKGFRPQFNPLGIEPIDMARANELSLLEIHPASDPERSFHFSASESP
jgi:hypothetical protein